MTTSRILTAASRPIGVLLLAAILLSGCATVLPDLDPPKVTIESVRSLPMEGSGPRFEISLRIVNPNSMALDIAGISYTMDLLDKEVISGVTNDVPVIEGYTEEVVTLEAGINLFEVLRLIGSLGGSSADELDYRFVAKVDFNGLVPTQRIEEVGTIALQ